MDGEHEVALKEVDWRHRAVTTLAQDLPAAGPGTQAHKKGAAVILATAIKHNGAIKFLNMPDAAAINLSSARREYQSWQATNPLLANQDLSSATHVFDCIAHGMGAVLAGYTAVEAFVNDTIPDGASYKRKTKKGKLETLDHDKIVRWCSLNEKMSEVLPSLKFPDASKNALWSDFRKLQDLRHRIIHTKKVDVTHFDGKGDPPDTIWSQVLDPGLPNPAEVALGLIKHIADSKPPHFAKFYPVG